MTSSDILVKHFKIEIPVYVGHNEKKRTDNLFDEELCSDLLRVYFLGKLHRVLIKKECKNCREKNIYYYELTEGEKVQYIPHEVSFEDVKRIMKDRRGGTRKGAGRNSIVGNGSVTLRIPVQLKNEFIAIVDMYAQLSSLNKDILQPMGRTTELERKKALEWLDMVSKYEHSRIERLKDFQRKEEENKRQLKLFPEDY